MTYFCPGWLAPRGISTLAGHISFLAGSGPCRRDDSNCCDALDAREVRERSSYADRPIGMVDLQEGEERARELDKRMAERRRGKATDGSAPRPQAPP